MHLFAVAAAAVYAAALLCFPQAGAEAAQEGLALCARVIIPSLFPYFVLSELAIGLGLAQWLGRRLAPVMRPLFHVDGAGGAALALGMVGGYPVGAGTARTLLEEGACSRAESERLLRFCNNAGPAFVLSVAGVSVFGSLAAGALLLAAHLTAALLVGILLRGPRGDASPVRTASPAPRTRREGALLPRSVRRALESTLQVCAYIVLFGVFLGLAEAVTAGLSLPDWLRALLRGICELSNGICSLEGLGDRRAAMAIAAFLLGWGGLCVHCQTAALLEGSGLPLAPYLRAKALQGAISAGLVWLVLGLFPAWMPVSAGAGPAETQPPLPLLAGALALAAVLLLAKRAGKRQAERL